MSDCLTPGCYNDAEDDEYCHDCSVMGRSDDVEDMEALIEDGCDPSEAAFRVGLSLDRFDDE